MLHHAPGVRRLRFIRKLPLLKGLSDQTIIKVGEQVSEEVFEVGCPSHAHAKSMLNAPLHGWCPRAASRLRSAVCISSL